MDHVTFSYAPLSLVYTRGSQWATPLRSGLHSELPQNATCLNLTERRFSGVRMVGQRGVFFVWKVTWWKWNGPVSCVWHFDLWHWSVLKDLWSVRMPVRPYGRSDVLWQIHACKHTQKSLLSPSSWNTKLGQHPHKHVITWWAWVCTDWW